MNKDTPEIIFLLNFTLLILSALFLLCYITKYFQVTSRLEDKQRQGFLIECVSKGHPPNECATAWKVAKQYN